MNTTDSHSMYYVAILCPPNIERDIAGLKNYLKMHFGCIAALKSPAHITLIAPFWFEESREMELKETLQAFPPLPDRLDVHLEGFSHFNKRVLFVDVKDDPVLRNGETWLRNILLTLLEM